MTRRLAIASALMFTVSLVVTGCAAPATPGVDQPAAPTTSEPCGSSADADYQELDVSEMPAPDGVALPQPDCLLFAADLLGGPFDGYVAFYSDTSGSIWSEYESALLAGGFTPTMALVDGVETALPNDWSKTVPNPRVENGSITLRVQGEPGTSQIRDGEALKVAIFVPGE